MKFRIQNDCPEEQEDQIIFLYSFLRKKEEKIGGGERKGGRREGKNYVLEKFLAK